MKHLNHIVEQNHRPSKRKMPQALGFKAFHAAHATLQDVEVVQMIRKRLMAARSAASPTLLLRPLPEQDTPVPRRYRRPWAELLKHVFDW